MTKTDTPLSILQISDLHILPTPGATLLGIDTELTFHAVLDQAFAAGNTFDLILVTGDLGQYPCVASYQRIQKKLASYDIPSLCLPGNHDDYQLMREVLNSGPVSCRRQYFLGGWQIISLNSQLPGAPGGHLSDQELSFLGECLAKNRDRHALIAVHHHCQKTHSIWMDGMMIDNSQEFFSVISEYPQVKAVTFGHIHQAMESLAGAVRIWGTPSTCFQFKPESTEFSVEPTAPGYRLIRLYADGRIESEIARLPGQLTGLQTGKSGY